MDKGGPGSSPLLLASFVSGPDSWPDGLPSLGGSCSIRFPVAQMLPLLNLGVAPSPSVSRTCTQTRSAGSHSGTRPYCLVRLGSGTPVHRRGSCAVGGRGGAVQGARRRAGGLAGTPPEGRPAAGQGRRRRALSGPPPQRGFGEVERRRDARPH